MKQMNSHANETCIQLFTKVNNMDDKIQAINLSRFSVPILFSIICVTMCHKMRRQHVGDEFKDEGLNTLVTQEVDAADIAANRFTLPSTTTKKLLRTTPYRVSFAEDCDYLVHYCLRAYSTGALCARTLFYTYYTFKNYCLMDFVNCMERYEVWQVVHMGPCFNITPLTEYLLYPYDDDYFLDLDYVIEDH